jgi:glycosyltransferase involved in cell wall biosynthesis
VNAETAAPGLIAHVNLARGYRGGERQTELLLRALAVAGWRQRLVARRGEPLARRLDGCAGLELREVPANVVAAAFALRGADLVHVHEARGLQAACISRMFGGAPYLVTRRVQQGPSHHGLNRLMYRQAVAVVALSQAIADAIGELDPRLSCRLIPSATADLPSEPGKARAIRARFGGFIVGHVGALVDAHKGQRQILAMARETARRAPGIQYLLVGGGRDAAELGVEAAGLHNLHFAGEVPDVGNYLAAFDLFLYPSRHEGLGSVLLDAMAFGLPIVATRVGGIPDIVRDGVNGLLCKVDDIAGLTAAVLSLHADAELRARMAAANRARAREFSAAVMAKRYIELYRGLLPGVREVVRDS